MNIKFCSGVQTPTIIAFYSIYAKNRHQRLWNYDYNDSNSGLIWRTNLPERGIQLMNYKSIQI